MGFVSRKDAKQTKIAKNFSTNLELVWNFSAPVGRSLIEVTPPEQFRIRSKKTYQLFAYFVFFAALREIP
ncbi:MAG: hypothetical protein FWC50_00670 [Planctomycetaceae bacterium]|nr:hypothetical protein [Planctomycetaceae bacterium]